MTFAGFVATVGGAAVATSGAVLAFVPRPRSWPVRLRWWLAGIIVPAVLTFGSALLAERTDGVGDSIIVGLGFLAALVVLILGHARAGDAWAWWLGNGAVALAWCVFVVLLAAALSHLEE